MPTINDVARAAGVSPMTVSRVLNHSGSVSGKKKDAVLRAIEELNYRPNLLARSLATNRSNTIGLLVTRISNPIYAAYIDSVTSRLRRSQLDVILYSADSYQTVRSGLSTLWGKQVDGVIMLPLELPNDTGPNVPRFAEYFVDMVSQIGKPILTIGNVYLKGCPHVLEDYAAGARLAVECLMDHGHKKIGYLRSIKTNYPWGQRTEGFSEAIEQWNLIAREAWSPASATDFSAARSSVGEWLNGMRGRELPTAMYCANDLMALGAMSALTDVGIRVPDDMSLIGHDGSVFSNCSHPRITTVAITAEHTGEAAAEMMANLLLGGDLSPDAVLLMPPRLLPGQTVRALP